jgi:hypothetical protein
VRFKIIGLSLFINKKQEEVNQNCCINKTISIAAIVENFDFSSKKITIYQAASRINMIGCEFK